MDREALRLARIADAEGVGRLANEIIVDSAISAAEGDSPTTIRCECGDDTCREPLAVSRDVYERVRSDSMLFLVQPGHEVPEAEHVIERGEGFEIVQKHEAVRPQVEESDPRSAD